MPTKINNAGLSGSRQPLAIMGRTYEEAQQEATRLGLGEVKTWSTFVQDIIDNHQASLERVSFTLTSPITVCSWSQAILKLTADILKKQRKDDTLCNMLFVHDDMTRGEGTVPVCAFFLFESFKVQDLIENDFYDLRNRTEKTPILPPPLVNLFSR